MITQNKILIVQPTLMHYRVRLYNSVATRFDVHVVCTNDECSEQDHKFTVDELDCQTLFGLSIHRGLLAVAKRANPDACWIFANANYPANILLTIWMWAKGVPVVLHGQGVYKPTRSQNLRVAVLRFWLLFATKYVTYAEVCTKTMIKAGFPKHKLITLNNRLEEKECVDTSSTANTRSILFVGRLRDGCEISRLVDAVSTLNRREEKPVLLHVIGDGHERESLKQWENESWLFMHGEATSEKTISDIASLCSVGVYPGRAGLSVLTFMRYGLPVIIAKDIAYHMGPEPSHVTDRKNGWYFDHLDPDGLLNAIAEAINSPELASYQRSASETYNTIHSRPYGDEMADILSCILEKTAPSRIEMGEKA